MLAKSEKPAGSVSAFRSYVDHMDPTKFFAGWFGGVCVTALCHPFDAVKVHSQVQHMTPLKAALNLIQEGGVAAFYRGVLSPITGVGLAYAMKFGVYGNLVSHYTQIRIAAVQAEHEEMVRKRREELERQMTPWTKTWRAVVSVVTPNANEDAAVPNIDPEDMVAAMKNAGRLPFHINVGCAAAGGVAEALVMTPFEVVKLRLLTQSIFDHREYHGGFDCARQLVREGGLGKLWLGLGATVVRDVPAAVIFFGAYGTLRGALLPASHCSLSDAAGSLLAGGISGALTWTVVLPLDNIKTHMQTSRRLNGEGMLYFARQIYREGGFRGFYVSMAPALFRASFANAILLTGVETCLRFSRLLQQQQRLLPSAGLKS
jgi:hypothetical protein